MRGRCRLRVVPPPRTTTMTHLALALLGPIRITLDDQPVAGFDYAKVRALLVYLAMEHAHAQPRDAVAELLWPDQPPQVGRSSLRQALAKLRQAIGDAQAEPAFLQITRETLQFNPHSHFTLDVARFEELAAPTCAHAPAEACASCAARYEAAAALYRGPFLEDAVPRDSQGFEEWALLLRERFEREAGRLLAALAGHYEHNRANADALRVARRALAIDPWHEPTHRQLMRLLAASGQRSAALAQYIHCRRVLNEDLGVEPEDTTTTLYEQIKSERGGAAEPPEAAPPATVVARPSLPAQPGAFVGRESELEELGDLLAERACRMITLTGPGGIGKTRLALRAAETFAPRFAHGAAWVPLAALSSPDLLPAAVARALHIPLDESAEPQAQLIAALAGQSRLLLLDNAEHLLGSPAAAASTASFLAALLAGAPTITLLLTSREPLRLQWEWLFDLRGLPFASRAGQPDALGYGAAQLLLERARQARRNRPLSDEEQGAVARICQLVEGMPLALELAASAAREHAFPTIADSIASGLDVLQAAQWDRPERHQSMRATFAYSWRLLAPDLQGTLAALAVFRGPISAAAAAAVAGASPAQLDALAERSLLRRDADGRWSIHELIRQFAAEMHGDAGAAVQEQYRGHFLGYVEQQEPLLRGPEQAAALDELGREYDNIRAALAGALDAKANDTAARLGAALWRFWWVRSYVREGRAWLEQIAIHADELGPALRARVFNALGALIEEQSDFAQAVGHYAAALALFRAEGDAAGAMAALNNLGGAYYKLNTFEQAAASFEESAELARAAGDRYGLGVALHNLAGVIYDSGGDMARARTVLEESLGIWRELGMVSGVAITLSSLGQMALITGDNPAAAHFFAESLPVLREHADARSVSLSLAGLGRASQRMGDYAAATAAYHEALTLRHQSGDRLGIAECCEGLGEVALAQGAARRTLRLYGAAAALREAIDSPVLPIDQAAYEATLHAARAQLGAAASAAWEAGRATSPDDAVEYALGG